MTATLAPAAPLTTSQTTDALFTASLTCGGMPPKSLVMDTVRKTISTLGVDACTAVVAGEFGDHPVEAVLRMRRARELVAELERATRPE